MNDVATRQDSAPAIQSNSETGALLSVIERVAMSPEADIDKMSALLDMQERVLNRQAQEQFSAAMADMQMEMPEVVERGQAHNTKYATFEDINAAVRPVLQKYGFAVTFRVSQQEGAIKVTAVLSHRGGHREETEMVLPHDTSGSKNAVQAVGSTVSYGKRYTMSALLNIATRGEDDDAQGATKVRKVTDFQASAIRQLVGKSPEKTKEWMKANYGNANQVPADEYNWIVETLREAGNVGD